MTMSRTHAEMFNYTACMLALRMARILPLFLCNLTSLSMAYLM